MFKLKGKFPQTTMWIGWVQNNFRNQQTQQWNHEQILVIHLRELLYKVLPEYVTPQEYNSPLTLYIDFHNFFFFLDINSPVYQIQS